jgi:fatty acid desaturase
MILTGTAPSLVNIHCRHHCYPTLPHFILVFVLGKFHVESAQVHGAQTRNDLHSPRHQDRDQGKAREVLVLSTKFKKAPQVSVI